LLAKAPREMSAWSLHARSISSGHHVGIEQDRSNGSRDGSIGRLEGKLGVTAWKRKHHPAYVDGCCSRQVQSYASQIIVCSRIIGTVSTGESVALLTLFHVDVHLVHLVSLFKVAALAASNGSNSPLPQNNSKSSSDRYKVTSERKR